MRRMFVLAERLSLWVVPLFLLSAILWRGGKSVESTWFLTGVALFAAFGTWGGRQQKGELSRWIWWPLAAFVAWTGLSFLTTTTGNYGLDEVLRDASLALLAAWTARTASAAHGPVLRGRVYAASTIGLVLACAIGIAVYALQPVDRFVGSFFDARFHTDYWPNAWADMVLVAWPLGVLWSGRWRRVWRVLLLGIVLGALLLSYSRGGMLAFGGQLILLALLTVWTERGISRRIGRGLAEALCVAVLAVVVFVGGNALRAQLHAVQSLEEKITFTAAEGTSSVDERRLFWKEALILSRQRPLTGWGPYSFRFVQPRLQSGVLQTSDHPHNVLLKLAAERGWPAVLFFIAFLAAVLVPAVLRVWRRGAGEDGLLLIAVLGLLAHSMIDYNLQFVGVALLFWILLGLLAAGMQRMPVPARVARGPELFLAIVLGVVALAEGRYLVLSSLGRRAEAAGNREAALQWYAASRGEQFSRDLHLSRANLFLEANQFTDAERALSDYAAQNAEDARLWILRGESALGREEPVEAAGHYERAVTLARFNYIEASVGLLQSLWWANRPAILNARRAEFEETLRAYHAAILQNAHFIALSSTVEGVMEFADLLGKAFPDRADAYRTLATAAGAHAEEERQRFGARPPGFLW